MFWISLRSFFCRAVRSFFSFASGLKYAASLDREREAAELLSPGFYIYVYFYDAMCLQQRECVRNDDDDDDDDYDYEDDDDVQRHIHCTLLQW